MKALKNILVGFIASFIGSIPLGYLNVIGYELYRRSNIIQLIYYLIGVVIIEAIVVFLTLYFANYLNKNQLLKKKIALFSVLFLSLLAIYFYKAAHSETQKYDYAIISLYPAFITGLVLSMLNFAQFPFWISSNLYLVSQNYVDFDKKYRLYYVFATTFGTFFGMLLLIVGLQKITKLGYLSDNFISSNVWIIFLGLAILQTIPFFKKYKKL
ncbi:hypothetical protein [Flavobacterium sp.]|uniref:hypothetical protein n=1 Tax=Flavobacterium sp. TaxID=239 RepID=UPI00286E4071|nr:hypothetical protein [Flavobacterium sp.]